MPSLKYEGLGDAPVDEGHARAMAYMVKTEGWKVFLQRLAFDAKTIEDHLFEGNLDSCPLATARLTGVLGHIRQIQGMEVKVLESMRKVQEKLQ